jgi:hypothetical protein
MNKIIKKATVLAATTLALGFGGVSLAEGPASAATSHSHHHVTKSEKQAIGAAKSYLSFTSFSKKGLIEQLHSPYGDGFSKNDATYAVNHIKVNWNKQAVKSAKNYLSFTHFSRSGLIHQLESPYGDQFTHAQAVYAANKVGLR